MGLSVGVRVLESEQLVASVQHRVVDTTQRTSRRDFVTNLSVIIRRALRWQVGVVVGVSFRPSCRFVVAQPLDLPW